MRSFSIESNGRLENTAIYMNGEQLTGIKEIVLNLDEEGTFAAIMSYEGSDGKLYTKQIFTDYMENIRIREAAFTEEEAEGLQLLTVESDGDIEATTVTLNDAGLEGIISLMIHLKVGDRPAAGGIRSWFGKGREPGDPTIFRAEITFRNPDGSTSVEGVF
jgi:hypothetical protein